MVDRLKGFIESGAFQNFIIGVIIVNAITLGLETSATAMNLAGPVLIVLDRIALSIFIIEIVLKLVVYRLRFFRDAWNIFDFLVVGVTLMPAGEGLSVLRSLRILRVLRLISVVPSLRKVVHALLRAIPGMGSMVALLSLVFYVAAVMATKLFGASFPDWFGSIGASFYTLFQVMTLESWSMGIVRPVMEVYPYAWLFFIIFILLTTFAVLNLFIAIIVDAMAQEHHAEEGETRAALGGDHHEIIAEIRALKEEVAALRREGR
ncbi:MAG: ion transporter [Oceanibaculum nanhaiense]|uniref:ion transporter n=1 Tax=Oceanibaculum nanhaiense TaxID=1909734 RepID=UPI0025A36DFE|nr:ion transporter [Oceanibaculum nanhaiense]MDM7946505.1 ion transporter [Oceanibaculum nanhaiense]